MANLVVSAAGAAIGFMVGGPTGAQYGWMAGSLIGAVAFAPTQKVEGPRLDDLSVTGLAYGQPIPFIIGTHRTAGQLAWSSGRREVVTRTRSDGKGGPKVQNTTYTYEMDALFVLSSNELQGLLRVWDNGKLVYSADDGATLSTLIASNEQAPWRRITFYSGAAGQLPDPTYEAAIGAGYAPSYLDMATVFIEGLQLGQSGQMRNLTFEVGLIATPAVKQDFQDHSPNAVAISQVTTIPGVNKWAGTVNSPAKFGAAGRFDGGDTFTPGQALKFYSAAPGTRLLPVEFFVRVWLYDTGDGSTSNWVMSCGNDDGNPPGLWIYRTQVAFGQVMRASYRGTQAFTLDSSVAPPKNTWYFFELTKVGGTMLMFFDGVPVGMYTNANLEGTALVCQPSEWRLGDRYGFSPCWAGYMDDFMFSRVAGNTSDYTPPSEPQSVDQFTEIYIPFYRIDTVQRGQVSIREAVEMLCDRAGLPPGRVDASALDAITRPCRALAVSQVTSTRNVLEMLGEAFFFQSTRTDKIVFLPRGQSVVATIPYEDLGTAAADSSTPEPFALERNSDIEIPAQDAITYANVDDDYQADTQVSDRLLTSQTSTATATVPLAFMPSEAKAIVEAKVTDRAVSIFAAPISLPRKYARLVPGDSVIIQARGSSFRMQLRRQTVSGGVLGFETVMEDPTVFVQAGITGGNYNPQTSVTAIAATYLLMLDMPLLRDSDDGIGLYLAGRGLEAPWPGAEVFESTDDLSYASRATLSEAAILGETISALGNWSGGNVFDEANSVTVDIGAGTLSSVTRDQLLNSTTLNAALLGNEVIQFRSASLLSAGVYLLSGLLRGRRGTERAIASHLIGERFVLLQPVGMRRVAQSTADLHATRYWRGVSFGRALATGVRQAVVNQGVSSKPFSPVDARANRAAADTILSWRRRTRMQSRFLGPLSSSVPLGEATEAYEIEIYATSGFVTVKRTLTSTTPSVTYTSADQVTDFGTTQSVLYVRIYQMSETVGRGFPLQATI